jgi:hypothetical protein
LPALKRKGSLARTAGIAAVAVFCPLSASANGRFPNANQLIIAPSSPQLMVLRTTFGLLVSHDSGSSWSWVCEGAYGYTVGTRSGSDPAIGVTQSSAIVAAMQDDGLAVSLDTGCAWARASTTPTFDVTVRPDRPHSAIALSWAPLGTTGPPKLLLTNDDGATWAPFGAPIVPNAGFDAADQGRDQPSTVDVAPSDPHRIYVSGVRVSPGGPQGALLESTDDGQTWTEHAVPINVPDDLDVFIGAVDPTNADRVYLRIPTVYGGRLVVTDDGGKTSRTVMTSQVPMPGFALSPDGSKVFVGIAGAGGATTDDGIYVAAASDLTFSKQSCIPVQCLTATATTLYACSSDATGGFALGASTDDGASFAPVLHLNGIQGPLACAADSGAAQCVDQWPPLRDQFADPSATTPPGATSGDAGCTGVDAGPTKPPSTNPAAHKGGPCTCTATGLAANGAPNALLALGSALGLLFVRRRRRALTGCYFWEKQAS